MKPSLQNMESGYQLVETTDPLRPSCSFLACGSHPQTIENFKKGITPISLVQACRRVGMVFDLWLTHPGQLVHLLERGQLKSVSDRAGVHPLRGLFEPSILLGEDLAALPVTKTRGKNQMKPRATSSVCFREDSFEFREGDRIKARFADEIRKLDVNGETHADQSRKYHNGQIQSVNHDGTFVIKWENGYDDMDTGKKADDMRHAYLQDEEDDGVSYVLRTEGCVGKVGAKEFFLLCLCGLLIVCAPEFAQTNSSESNFDKCAGANPELSSFCSLLEHLEKTRADIGWELGVFSVISCALFGFIVVPFGYVLLRLLFPAAAKKCRRLYLNFVLDPPRLYLLPTVYGAIETVILWLGASAMMTVLCTALKLMSAGVVPLGIVLVTNFLKVANCLFGECAGLREVRTARIMAILEKHLDATHIDMEKETLRVELERLLTSTFNSGIIAMSLPFLTLLSSLVDDPAADSCRMRTFLVIGAYADFKHVPKDLATLKHRYDVIIDVFLETCKVPSINLEGERWHEHGHRIPWHLAVSEEAVAEVETYLVEKLNMPPGAGCFTWRSTRSGLWHTRESENQSGKLLLSKQLAKRQKRVDVSLNYMALDASLEDDPEIARPLLRAGGDPNYQQVKKQSSLYRACVAGKLETAKLLIEFKGDINRETDTGETPISCTNDKFKSIKHSLLQFVASDGDEISV